MFIGSIMIEQCLVFDIARPGSDGGFFGIDFFALDGCDLLGSL
jgi:hypothetical protein